MIRIEITVAKVDGTLCFSKELAKGITRKQIKIDKIRLIETEEVSLKTASNAIVSKRIRTFLICLVYLPSILNLIII